MSDPAGRLRERSNCQGGWAALMLAAASPEETGPIVVVGAPISTREKVATAGG
jgi:hypothetical protein